MATEFPNKASEDSSISQSFEKSLALYELKKAVNGTKVALLTGHRRNEYATSLYKAPKQETSTDPSSNI